MWDGLPHWPVPEVWCGFWITGITHGFVSAVLDWKYEWSLSRGRGEQRRGENKRSTWKDLRTEPRRKKNKMSKLLSLSDGALSRKDSYWFSKNQCNLLIVLTSLLKKEFNNLVNKLIHFLSVKKSLWSSWICISHLICQIPPPHKNFSGCQTFRSWQTNRPNSNCSHFPWCVTLSVGSSNAVFTLQIIIISLRPRGKLERRLKKVIS